MTAVTFFPKKPTFLTFLFICVSNLLKGKIHEFVSDRVVGFSLKEDKIWLKKQRKKTMPIILCSEPYKHPLTACNNITTSNKYLRLETSVQTSA